MQREDYRREDPWTVLNFGATIWIVLGGIAMMLGYTTSAPLDWSIAYVACIIVLSVKLLLIFKTNEILSLQHFIT